MDALEAAIDLKIPAEEKLNSSGHNPGLRALLSIKNFSATLKKDYARLLEIEKELNKVYKDGLKIIEENGSPGAGETWMINVAGVNVAITGLKNILNTGKEKIELSEKEDFPGLWTEMVLHLKALKNRSNEVGISGTTLLPGTVQPQWEKDFLRVEQPLVQQMVLHVESCRVLLQMIERYTPDELNKITKIIVDQIPLDFTYEEAATYQKEYYAALVNFKKEFKEEKNLWDKFLDILAGGTHQSPSERVMLERWIEGEKGDL